MRGKRFQWALVTGASSGIGEAICHLLASKGINLILHGRNKQALELLAKSLSREIQTKVLIADLCSPADRRSLVSVMEEMVPELVINNAGFGLYGEALTYHTDEQLEILEVNGKAVLELTLEAARILRTRERKGVIVNVASAAAFPIFPEFAVYAAVKRFVVSFSESFDEEVRSYGIRVLASCPGMVDTQFKIRAGGSKEQKTAPRGVMSASYAAEQIWQQIESGEKVHLFHFLYKIMTFLVLYVLPKQFVAKIVKKNINERHQQRPLIKSKKENIT